MNFLFKAFKLFVLLLLVVGTIVYFVVIKPGREQLTTFFSRARTAPIAEIRDQLIVPTFSDGVDTYLVAIFLKELATRPGEFKQVQANGSSWKSNGIGDSKELEISGNYEFEKQTVPMTLVFQGGKLLRFSVRDKELAAAILPLVNVVPPDTAPYVKRAETLLRGVVEKKPDAIWEMMHESLQKALGGLENFKKSLTTQLPDTKALEIKFKTAKTRADDKSKLDLLFECTLDGTPQRAHVTFEFANLNGHLIGFALPSDKQ